MLTPSLSYCNCCGLPNSTIQIGADCPRCGYPVDALKEERFLHHAISDLQRIVTYGGANLTITQLIQRYQARLSDLERQKALAQQNNKELVAVNNQSETPSQSRPLHSQTAAIQTPPAVPVTAPVVPVLPAQSGPEQAGKMFSLKSFLEDQTINIVASLGAFLILVGSLSFVATTSDLVLAFLLMFIVHAVFGAVGIISYRFQSFRIVAVIYTAIFALLIPLVGFSGYRLVTGNLVHIETPLLISIASIYAALIYGALAVYQRFTPFAYLAVVALAIADLALAINFHLTLWWWPCTLMGLAFPALLSVSHQSRTRFFAGSWSVLREPVRMLMYSCIAVCLFGIMATSLFSLSSGVTEHITEDRVALMTMLLLLLCWSCLFVWRTRKAGVAQSTTLQFLACALSVAYTFNANETGYVFVLICIALLYHGLVRFAERQLQHFKDMTSWLEAIALLLVALLPLIAFPDLFWQIFLDSMNIQQTFLSMTGKTTFGFLAIGAGCVLTLSVIQHHTKWQNTLATNQTGWPWLLLLSGFLLNAAFSVAVLWLHLWLHNTVMWSFRSTPVWSFFGLALVLIALAVLVRQKMSARWAAPLDVVALCIIGETLVLGLGQSTEVIIFLLFFFAALVYGIALYQRRAILLALPMLLALLALSPLLQHLPALYIVALVLPLLAALQYSFITHHLYADAPMKTSKISRIKWEWPLLVAGILYGCTFALYDAFAPVSTVQSWLRVGFPTGMEVALIAIVWYAAAALTRLKGLLLIAAGFAVLALLVPNNSFWFLTWLAPILALLAFGVNRLAGRDWALPFYATAVIAAIIMGITGYTHGLYLATTWALLVFAVDLYLIGYAEHEPLLFWIAVVFASSSIYCSGMIGGFYRFFPPIMALSCATLGIGIGCLKWLAPTRSSPAPSHSLLGYSLPLYAIAFVAAVFTGIYGLLAGVNNPFYTAIPDALLIYALVAYIITSFERKPLYQWVVAGFAIWGILSATQLITAPEYLLNGICASVQCDMQAQNAIYYLTGIALVTGMLGLLTRLFNRGIQTKFAWNWSWYLSSLVAIVTTASWGYGLKDHVPFLVILCAFILLSLLIMLVERVPEIVVVPVALAAWAISLVHWDLWQQMVGYTLLCILIFSSQFVWKKLPPASLIVSPAMLHQLSGLGGQICVVLAIIGQGGLSASTGLLAHVGASALLVLATLLFWAGRLQVQRTTRRWCGYMTGLLLALVVPWELLASGQTHLDVLTLAPASYLIVISPFLSRDETLPYHHRIGQCCSVLGAILLLAPALWLSFSAANLPPTLILAGEALVLLLLGVGLRVRFFVLSGAALVVVAAMHALFLPSLGLPPSLALTILGGTLLAIATTLSLARRRLRTVWTRLQ
ncbi:hypothetical protein KSF_062240 [Reticulibacter mediterranei]|uniref:Uncharacterized protein n=1 Tax=Reticulibacter mediterranei TaxID=2778369 RepID=A0A8J3IKI7_9CHLR|nr:hypothetical protein [Reticulibacter mediterranei]GHO96176.1 hypothetical protein KSF_062240 [Reticulibacter mediterranei]